MEKDRFHLLRRLGVPVLVNDEETTISSQNKSTGNFKLGLLNHLPSNIIAISPGVVRRFLGYNYDQDGKVYDPSF